MDSKTKKRCPSCNSRQIYIKSKTREIVCRDCGKRTKLKRVKNE